MAMHGNGSHMMDYWTELIVHLILLKFSVPNNLLEQKSLDNIALKMLMTRFEPAAIWCQVRPLCHCQTTALLN